MKKVKGSLTIEAALAMPFYLFAICQIIFWISFLNTESALNMASAMKARQMAETAYLEENEEGSSDNLIEISKGEMLNGSYFERIAVARKFTGRYYEKNIGEGSEEDNRIVFVTRRGKVYHTSNICRHLKVSVREVAYEKVKQLRNKSGAKYYPCIYCARGRKLSGSVYVTGDGTRIHSKKNCGGIKRTVDVMTKKEAEAQGYRGCARCGNG